MAGAEVEHLPAVRLEGVVAQVVFGGQFRRVVPRVAVGLDGQLGPDTIDGEIEGVLFLVDADPFLPDDG